MKRLLLIAATAMVAVAAFAGPVAAVGQPFGAVYAHDEIFRVFGNPASVPEGTGTDPFAKFTNSTNSSQLGVAEFAPGDPGDSHGGRWAVYSVTWTGGDSSTLVTSWNQLEDLATAGDLTITRNPTADFRCPVLGDPQPIG
ncbi:MAG TPA: hypothetical protein VKR30_10270 [Candidatus Limnocylindrales bacterium]|nr:hypothetical protein [Candidatus Limnocylindrales bacterium]